MGEKADQETTQQIHGQQNESTKTQTYGLSRATHTLVRVFDSVFVQDAVFIKDEGR